LCQESPLANQPKASVFMGSTAIEIFSVRSQVEHSNVRVSNPRRPAEMRASAISCLQTGHIGRSFGEPRRFTSASYVYASLTGRSSCWDVPCPGGGVHASISPRPRLCAVRCELLQVSDHIRYFPIALETREDHLCARHDFRWRAGIGEQCPLVPQQT
jgi:hypothetical protein